MESLWIVWDGEIVLAMVDLTFVNQEIVVNSVPGIIVTQSRDEVIIFQADMPENNLRFERIV
jgi:hypothetical protein